MQIQILHQPLHQFLLEHHSIQLAGACGDCHPHELAIGMFKTLVQDNPAFMRDTEGENAHKKDFRIFGRREDCRKRKVQEKGKDFGLNANIFEKKKSHEI